MKRNRIITLLLAMVLLTTLCCGSISTVSAGSAPHVHQWMKWSEKDPTCTKNGIIVYVCSCGEKKTETIPALGHDWKSWKTVKEATCGKDGSKERTCKRCGKTEKKTISATGKHSFVWKTAKKATCDAKGKEEQVCSVCGAKGKTRTVAATGHDWDEGTITKEPGYLNPGETTYTCKKCGDTRTEEIPVKSLPISLYNNDNDESGVSETTFDPLRIVTQPAGGSIDKDGGSLLLSVEAAGGKPPYTYQWRKEWNAKWWPLGWRKVENGTNSTLEAHEGNYKYYCKVFDSNGDFVNSDTVVVDWNLYIEQQPVNTNIQGKDSVILVCRAAGGEPYGEESEYPYQYCWCDSEGINAGYGPLLPVDHVGEYYCHVVDASLNTVQSKTAIVYEADPLVITNVAENQYLREGQDSVVFATVFGGVKPYSVSWQRDGKDIPTDLHKDSEYSAKIVGDSNKEVNYTMVVTDNMGETASVAVSVFYDQLEIADQPVGGILYPNDDNPVSISITVAEGEAPLNYTLYRNGEIFQTYNDMKYNVSQLIDQSGEYYFHIEDATGRWADSNIASVMDYSFSIDHIDVSGDINKPGDSVILTPVTNGGIEPISYQWWFEGERNGKIVSSTGVEGKYDVCIAKAPGLYRCLATDGMGNCSSAYVRVNGTGTKPYIVLQPKDVTLKGNEQNKYSVKLSCEAVSSTGDNSKLDYTWFVKANNRVTSCGKGKDLKLSGTEDSISGQYFCQICDNATHEITDTLSATVQVELSCIITNIAGPMCEYVHYKIIGGIGPYKVELFQQRILSWDYTANEKQTMSVSCYHDVRTDKSGEIVLSRIDTYYEYPIKDGDNEQFRLMGTYPDYYLVVTGANGIPVTSKTYYYGTDF